MSSQLNKERFDALAQQWDSKPARVEGAMRFVDKILDEIKEDISDFRLLDYGSGSGLVSFGFANKVSKIDGMDNSGAMVDVYNEKASKIGLENISASTHDINNEHLENEIYDLIATNMTMHHIKDTKMFIEKLSSGLKKDGYLFIADLVTEDGDFHSDNKGVEHFGFEMEKIKDIFIDVGLTDVSIEILNKIEKPNNIYEVFIVKGRK